MRHIGIILGILCATTFVSAESLLLLPIAGDTTQSENMATVNQLYRDAVVNQFKGTVLPRPTLTEPCGDRDCAIIAARNSNADEVIYSTFHRLGSRWVFSSTLLNRDGRDAFNQRLTALSIEDMEAVTQRMTDAILNHKALDQAATLDNITQKEVTQEPERRQSLYKGGIALGYLYPVNHSFSYMKNQNNYGLPFATTYKPQNYSQLFRLSWLNTWQFRNNLLLDAEVVGTLPVAVGADLNLDYLFNRTDFTPFVGGGVGVHLVHPDDNDSNGVKNNSGPTLNLQGGMMLFRTYDINVMLRGQYQMVLNSDKDNGVSFDVGITYGKKEKEGAKVEHGFWYNAGKFYLYLLAGSLILSAIGAASAR